MKIKKAIIPAAGLGTRFLPATKALPKEMLPIVDKPAIQYIVEEAVMSGINDIIIISGRHKRAIEDHFDKSYELEDSLYRKYELDKLKEIQDISKLANIHYIRQSEPRGLGDAILCAKSFIGDEPFAVLLGDDVIESDKPGLSQLIEVYDNYNSSVIGVQRVLKSDVSKYGIVQVEDGVNFVKETTMLSIVEKPAIESAPSNIAVLGRYILNSTIFDVLERLESSENSEIQLTEAIQVLNKTEQIMLCEINGNRYDIGDKAGFIKANIEFGLKRDDIKKIIKTYIKNIYESQDM